MRDRRRTTCTARADRTGDCRTSDTPGRAVFRPQRPPRMARTPGRAPAAACSTSFRARRPSRLPQEYSADAREPAARADRDRHLAVGYLCGAGLPAQLPNRLDQEEDPPHAGMAARESAAVGVERQAPAAPQVALRDEGAALALLAEAGILEQHEHGDREAVVELDGVDVARAQPRARERLGRTHGGRRSRVIAHLADVPVR